MYSIDKRSGWKRDRRSFLSVEKCTIRAKRSLLTRYFFIFFYRLPYAHGSCGSRKTRRNGVNSL